MMIEDEIPCSYGHNAAYSGHMLAIRCVFIRRQWMTVYHLVFAPR